MINILMIKYILIIVFISGCVQEPITEIAIPEHPFQIYEFSYNVRESVKIKSNDENSIRSLLRNSENLTIIFNGTTEDNGIFAVASFNIIEKLQTFYSFEQKIITDFPIFYFENNTWKNKTGNSVKGPDTSDASLWFLGPNTGATENSVNIDGNIIFVQGTTKEDLIKASDKLVLIVMGIEEKDLSDK